MLGVPDQIKAYAPFFHLTMHPKLVIAACMGYVTIVKSWDIYNSRKNPTPCSGRLFTGFVVAHNVLLAAFSAVTFYFQVQLFKAHASRYESWWDVFYGQDEQWIRDGLHLWSWIFYLSKYYEFLDTAILLAKGKRSNFLQTYHHVGTVFIMWLLVASGSVGAWVFNMFNSFIHTVMYTYYGLTAIGFKPAWKQLVTALQMTQFALGDFFGMLVVVYQCLHPSPLDKTIDVYGWFRVHLSFLRPLASFLTVCFSTSLLVLFMDFSKRTYGDKKPRQGQKKKLQ